MGAGHFMTKTQLNRPGQGEWFEYSADAMESKDGHFFLIESM